MPLNGYRAHKQIHKFIVTITIIMCGMIISTHPIEVTPIIPPSGETTEYPATKAVTPEQLTAAIDRALAYLASTQEPCGGWHTGSYGITAAVTGFALRAFLDQGYTPSSPQYGTTVQRAIDFLVACYHDPENYPPGFQQDCYGGRIWNNIYSPTEGGALYTHGAAIIALVDAYYNTQNSSLLPIIEDGIGLILRAQNTEHKPSSLGGPISPASNYYGGWRYHPSSTDSDTSLTGWQVAALCAAKTIGVPVPEWTFPAAKTFIDKCYNSNDGGYGYVPNGGSGTGRSGASIFSLQQMGYTNNDQYNNSINYIMNHLPAWGNSQHGFFYYWYYATMVMFNEGGSDWETWNNTITTVLVNNQNADGSWTPQYWFEPNCGANYATGLGVLTLQVCNRTLEFYSLHTLNIKVYDEFDVPIEGVVVEVTKPSGAVIINVTDANGEVNFYKLFTGTYKINFTKSGFESESIEVELVGELSMLQIMHDIEPPTLTLLQPTGGETLAGASYYYIKWLVTENRQLLGNSTILYSTDAGYHWHNVTTDALTYPGLNTYRWLVPTVTSTTCMLKIYTLDRAGNLGSNTTDTTFSIDSTPPQILDWYPTGDSVAVTTKISILFSKVMNHTATELAFKLTPAVDGEFSWELNRLIFTPTEPLARNSTYNVTLTTDAKDAAGFHIHSELSWEFSTELLELQYITGNMQSGVVGQLLMEPFTVRVLSARGTPIETPVPNVKVIWHIDDVPPGSLSHELSASQTLTDSEGYAAVYLNLGERVGTYVVSAILEGSPGSPCVFKATAIAGEPVRIELIPTPVTVSIGQAIQFEAIAYDSYNNPIRDLAYRWELVGDIGTVNATSGYFIAGEQPGTGKLIACWNGLKGIANIIVALEQKCMITGTVTDIDGNPLAYVKITAICMATGNVVGATTSLQSGTYQLLGLDVGAYIIRANLTGYAIAEHELVVLEDQEIIELNFQLLELTHPTLVGRLIGIVTDSTGAPIKDVKVTIIGTNISGTTDSNGKFMVVGIPAGNVIVEISKPGYETIHVNLTITAMETTYKAIELPELREKPVIRKREAVPGVPLWLLILLVSVVLLVIVCIFAYRRTVKE